MICKALILEDAKCIRIYWAMWFVMPVLGRERQEDYCRFKASLNHEGQAVCVYMTFVCAYMTIVCTHVCSCRVCSCRSQRQSWMSSLIALYFFFLRQSLSLNLEFIIVCLLSMELLAHTAKPCSFTWMLAIWSSELHVCAPYPPSCLPRPWKSLY